MKILIGCPARQDEETFELYINSLRKLKTGGHDVHLFFILHNSPHLKKYLLPHEFVEYQTDEEYVKTDETHHWTNRNLYHVQKMKNLFLDMVKQQSFDYFFLVDSDILLHEDTLIHLLKQEKKIISEVFWTKWNPNDEEQPNAWTHDFYSFDRPEKIWSWHRAKSIFEVGGTGAVILIHKDVVNAGVNYSPIFNISFSEWEDRAFCIRAAVAGFKIYMDTNFPAVHLYRKEDVERVKATWQK